MSFVVETPEPPYYAMISGYSRLPGNGGKIIRTGKGSKGIHLN